VRSVVFKGQTYTEEDILTSEGWNNRALDVILYRQASQSVLLIKYFQGEKDRECGIYEGEQYLVQGLNQKT